MRGVVLYVDNPYLNARLHASFTTDFDERVRSPVFKVVPLRNATIIVRGRRGFKSLFVSKGVAHVEVWVWNDFGKEEIDNHISKCLEVDGKPVRRIPDEVVDGSLVIKHNDAIVYFYRKSGNEEHVCLARLEGDEPVITCIDLETVSTLVFLYKLFFEDERSG